MMDYSATVQYLGLPAAWADAPELLVMAWQASATKALKRWWHAKILPGHFERGAYAKYGYRQRKSNRLTREEWREAAAGLRASGTLPKGSIAKSEYMRLLREYVRTARPDLLRKPPLVKSGALREAALSKKSIGTRKLKDRPEIQVLLKGLPPYAFYRKETRVEIFAMTAEEAEQFNEELKKHFPAELEKALRSVEKTSAAAQAGDVRAARKMARMFSEAA